MSSIAARQANKRVCQLQPNGMLSRGTHAYPGANASPPPLAAGNLIWLLTAVDCHVTTPLYRVRT